jgi:hypothetical protein
VLLCGFGGLVRPGGVWPAGLVGTGDEGELLADGEAEGRGRGEGFADGDADDDADGTGPACGLGCTGLTPPPPR